MWTHAREINQVTTKSSSVLKFQLGSFLVVLKKKRHAEN